MTSSATASYLVDHPGQHNVVVTAEATLPTGITDVRVASPVVTSSRMFRNLKRWLMQSV